MSKSPHQEPAHCFGLIDTPTTKIRRQSTNLGTCTLTTRLFGGSWRWGMGVGGVGERSNFKKIPTHTQDHGDGIATRWESNVHVPSQTVSGSVMTTRLM